MRVLSTSLAFALWSAASFVAAAAWADPVLPPSVLVLNQSNSFRPWPNQIIGEIRAVMSNRVGGSVPVYVEDLDLYRFNGPGYLESLAIYFRDKYRDKPIGVVTTVGSSALDYALRLRTFIWPNVPIVFAAVDKKTGDLNIVPGVTGITVQLTLADMIKAARSLLPDTIRFALVGDLLKNQLYYSRFAQELVDYSKDFQFIDLTGLSLAEVKQRVAALPEHTVILYVGINADRTSVYVSAELVPQIAAVANRPIIVSVETYFGTGAIGGYLLSPRQVGQEAGQLALRVLGGEDPSNIPVTASSDPKPVFDWRQLRRWNISDSSLPPGSEIRFRSPDLWEQYRWEIIAALGIVLIQSGMIGRLAFERHRRRAAEEESRQRVLQVIHLNRTATAGALSASVAHELNQPLGAILNYAETADVLLDEKSVNVQLLKEIIADIRRDDQRASDVIKHLRTLLKQRSETELQTFDLNDAIDVAIRIVGPEASKRGIALDTAHTNTAFPVRADQVQLQQVILNLVANGMDAVSDSPPSRRRLMVQAIPSGKSDVEVLVSDSGAGIAKDSLRKIFDTFYTTKATGTGLGLSIARTIVESYGGKIWAENREGGGAVFRFTLPLTTEISRAH
jgi:signal transduction histidine kinase